MKRLTVLAMLAGVAVMLWLCLAAPAGAGVRLNTTEAQVLKLINTARADAGLQPLRAQAALAKAARAHTTSMASTPFFSHVSLDGHTPGARAVAAGYRQRGFKTWLVGENIAWGTLGYATPEQIVDAWLDSPEHKKIMLDPRFRDAGIGVSTGSYTAGGVTLDDVTYFTLDVGRRTK